MNIGPGSQIGSYQVLSPLGQGGMGVVFRALDTKLQREVALKVLPPHFADDPERMARFQREAQVLASLNHPGIAQVHGFEESGGNRCIVMELVEGETIQDRLRRGPIPIDEASLIATQIAEALEAAHEKGIVHRDLKPANIKITREGKSKVLDFGLAKAFQEPQTPALSNSPTLMSSSLPGVILGTAAYMSPEQAKGQETDRTSDVWSFGCVLYEMLTGMVAFQGETLGEIIAAVLRSEPDWNRLPAETPENLRRLLRRCLQKDRKHRLQNIGDARIEIEDATLETVPELVARRASPTNKRWTRSASAIARSLKRGAFGVLLIALIATLAFLAWRPQRSAPESDRPMIRLSVDLGPEATAGEMITASISPDGTRIVFTQRNADGVPMLATRRLDEAKVTLLPGTGGALNPFFSPDGQWVGFVGGGLKKVLVQGGAPVNLVAVGTPRGATWTADGFIILPLSNQAALVRVPDGGGQPPQPVTELESGEISHRWPQILPGSRAVLFTGRAPTLNSYENASIDVVTLATKARKTIWRGGYFGRYLPTRGNRGHLVYLHEGVLFAVPFDPERLELEGTPVPVVDGIASDPITGGGQFDVSANGTLVFLEGIGRGEWPMVLLDAAGKSEPILSKPGMYYSPRFSPDGKRLAFAIESGNGSDVFVYDLSTQSTTRLTFTQQGNIEPVWTPDGKHIVYRSIRPAALWWVRADGVGEPQRLVQSNGGIQACSFSPDGMRVLYQASDPPQGFDVLALPLDLTDADHPKMAPPERLIATPANEGCGAFSPDGRWIAYSSNESGKNEVYVRRAADAAGKWQLSIGGGNMPMWSRNGREIFYQAQQGTQIMVADYEVKGESFVAGKPRVWSPTEILAPGFVNMDLAPDGKHFAVFPRPEGATQNKGTAHVTFLLNFFDELNRRAPAGRK